MIRWWESYIWLLHTLLQHCPYIVYLSFVGVRDVFFYDLCDCWPVGPMPYSTSRCSQNLDRNVVSSNLKQHDTFKIMISFIVIQHLFLHLNETVCCMHIMLTRHPDLTWAFLINHWSGSFYSAICVFVDCEDDETLLEYENIFLWVPVIYSKLSSEWYISPDRNVLLTKQVWSCPMSSLS
jgi:hypothetical protein